MAVDISSFLAGKHAFVTGASRGIGQAIANELAKMGADITLAARDLERLQENANTIREQYEVKTSVLALDLQDDQAITEVVKQTGPVDILINNAGVAPSAPFAPS
jgi:short-subunit dehydrogenase